MKVNVEGLLCHAGRKSGGIHQYSLDALARDLYDLRQRHRAGEGDAGLKEFFETYVFSESSSTKP